MVLLVILGRVVPVEEPSGWCRGRMMKYFFANQHVLGLQSRAGGSWWLLGEGGCLVGSGLLLKTPLGGGTGGSQLRQQLQLLLPQHSKPPWLWKIMHPQLPVGISTWSPGWLFQAGRQSSALPWLNPLLHSPCRGENQHLSGCHLFILSDSELAETLFDG